ncbi:MAG TPA: AmmeMemoRadiSam system protein A [Thermoanaerobaculia bacterium]|nr:AmmeMemoRadiSam system protein A [Thermoanaerobaculia bacterium]
MLNHDQRTELLRIARQSIEAVLDGRRPELDFNTLDADLKRPSGAFVTLNERSGDLRGCIGSIEPVAPLAQAVSASAVNAAFRDPRFYPVQKEELPNLHIEISVMSPIVPVNDVEEIEVGRDGLIITRGNRSGLLLPQVATDYDWDRDTFLRQTCIKAGLPSDCWRSPDCRIEKFSAEVFGE